MRLTPSQIDAYHRDGFIVLEGLLSAAEVAAMKADLERIQKIDTDHLVREKAGGLPKPFTGCMKPMARPPRRSFMPPHARRACSSPRRTFWPTGRSTSTTPNAT